jgi:hypothetical protein
MSGLAMVTDAPVSMVRWYGLSRIQPSEIRLSFVLLASTLSAKRGTESDDAGVLLITPAVTRFPNLDWPPHQFSADSLCLGERRSHTGSIPAGHSCDAPVGAVVTSRSLSGNPAAVFASSVPIPQTDSTRAALVSRRDASKNPEQCIFSESQYSESKQPGILVWHLILSFPGRRMSTRWEGRELKDWVCLAPSLTGEAACPSETACCCTSSSSVVWWFTHVRSGGPLPAATSGTCKFYNPSVSALRLTHLGTLVTGRFTRIWGFHSSPNTSEHWLRVSTQS